MAWSSITATDFYKNADDKDADTQEDKKEIGGNAWFTNTAHKGNILHGKELAFAFAKIKKASNFCEEIGASAGFFGLMQWSYPKLSQTNISSLLVKDVLASN